MTAIPQRMHTVRWGETLATIARTYYGDVNLAPAIYDANRGVLRGPNNLQPYTQLVIPNLAHTATVDVIEEDNL